MLLLQEGDELLAYQAAQVPLHAGVRGAEERADGDGSLVCSGPQHTPCFTVPEAGFVEDACGQLKSVLKLDIKLS